MRFTTLYLLCFWVLMLALCASACQKEAPAPEELKRNGTIAVTTAYFEALPKSSDADTMSWEGWDFGMRIEYPVVNGLADPAVEAALNEAIDALIFQGHPEDALSDFSLDTKYGYTIIGESLFSVQLYSQYYHREAAHPWRGIYTLVYDLSAGKQLTIDDVLIAPENLSALIIDGTFQTDVEWDYEEEYGRGNCLADLLAYQDLGRQFYLTESRLAIVLNVNHAIGDWRTSEADYTTIWDELTPEFQALLGDDNI